MGSNNSFKEAIQAWLPLLISFLAEGGSMLTNAQQQIIGWSSITIGFGGIAWMVGWYFLSNRHLEAHRKAVVVALTVVIALFGFALGKMVAFADKPVLPEPIPTSLEYQFFGGDLSPEARMDNAQNIAEEFSEHLDSYCNGQKYRVWTLVITFAKPVAGNDVDVSFSGSSANFPQYKVWRTHRDLAIMLEGNPGQGTLSILLH